MTDLGAKLEEYVTEWSNMSREAKLSDIWVSFSKKEEILVETILPAGIHSMHLKSDFPTASVTAGQEIYGFQNLSEKSGCCNVNGIEKNEKYYEELKGNLIECF